MVYLSRLLFSGKQKILIAVSVVLLLSLPGVYPKIIESLLAFCFGGVVPGTNIVLSPDTIIWSVVAILSAMVLAVIFRIVLRVVRKRQFTPITVTVIPSEPIVLDISFGTQPSLAAVPNPRPVASIPFVIRRSFGFDEKIAKTIMRVRISTVKILSLVLVAARIISRNISNGLMMVSSYVLRTVKRALVLSGYFLRQSMVFAWIASKKLLYFSGQKLSAFWQWIEPYLWKFDEWLELKTRQLEAWVARKMNQYDTFRTMHGIGKEYKKSLNTSVRLFVANIIRSKSNKQ